MEQRQLLSASPYTADPIHVGVVYFEDHIGSDIDGDVFDVAYHGGAAGTELTRLVINTDRDGDGLTEGDCYFDTAQGGLGVSGSADLTVLEQDGVTLLDYEVDDGGTQLILTFSGFDPGESFKFSIDVDEKGRRNSSAVAEGAEFQESQFVATFTAPHHHETTAGAKFWDYFNFASEHPVLADMLPTDKYAGICLRDQTAGAVDAIEQEPLPISIAGTVFEDYSLDNSQDPGDPGIAGVKLALWRWNDIQGQYVDTGLFTLTDHQGRYEFTDVAPGRYQIRETQPSGMFDVGAAVGSVGGATRGTVLDANTLADIELFGGDVGVEYDFAEAAPAALSGYVYHDANNNGLMETGEQGIAGATVQLHYIGPLGTAPTITLTSAADGSWAATSLLPGSWRVEEITPDGYYDGLDTAGTAGGVAQNPGDAIGNISLTSGQVGTDYLFGELMPNCINGYVYEDQNGNALKDAPDTPLANVTLDLYDAGGRFVMSTTTDIDGYYCFGPLEAGTYTVIETTPDGYVDGADFVGTVGGVLDGPDSIRSIPLVSDTHGEQYNFLEIMPSTLSGRVIEDLNGDGTIDPGEPPIPGTRIELIDSSGQVIDTTTSDASGAYRFTDVMPGTYTVRETTPNGFQDGADFIGTAGGSITANDTIGQVVVTSGTHATDYDFLEYRFGRIEGRVMYDRDGNHAIDASPTAIPGTKVELLGASGQVLRTTTTDADGRYAFVDLAPGEYAVRETTPAGLIDGADFVGSLGGSIVSNDHVGAIVVASGTHGVDYDFLEMAPSSISGRVIEDLNGNGTVDPGEPPIPDALVELLDASGSVLDFALTDADGAYAFEGLAPGTYTVRETDPPGFVDGAERVGSHGGTVLPPDSIGQIVLVSGTTATDYDFLELRLGSIRGRVMIDADNDGAIDAAPTPIAGVKVELLSAAGQVLTTTQTDNDGRYAFTDLMPGVYTVRETTPAGLVDGADFIGSAGGSLTANDTIGQITIDSGVQAVDYDFLEVEHSRITGHVYVDANGNGQHDAGEAPIAGAQVDLLDADGNTIATRHTDSDGYYAFLELLPGIYSVRETTPTGYYDGNDWPGTAGGSRLAPDTITDIALVSGTTADDYDFLELEPVSLSGYVYEDLDDDGIMDIDEAAIAGVTMQLLDASGQPTGQTAVTGASGYYEFTGLDPNATYGVAEAEQPSGYLDGKDTAGSHGGTVDSAHDRITGVSMRPSTHAVDYNFGEIPPAGICGLVYVELNGDDIRQVDEPVIEGVTIHLRDDQGQIVATTTTDADGRYCFQNLPPGVYQIEEIQPDPDQYLQGASLPGTAGGRVQRDDLIVDIPLTPGAAATQYNFWEQYQPVTISGYVFQDGEAITYYEGQDKPAVGTVRDGQLTGDDRPITGAVLVLADASGAPLEANITAVTDETGYYEFTGLPPGVYTVLQQQPSGFEDGIDTPGPTTGHVISPTPTDPGDIERRDTIHLYGYNPSDAIVEINVQRGGSHASMNNFSEVVYTPQDAPTPPPVTPPAIPPMEPLQPRPAFGAPSVTGVLYSPTPIYGVASLGYGGGGTPLRYTWHLSVINAGAPRAVDAAAARTLGMLNVSLTTIHGSFFDPTLWRGPNMNQGRWIFAGSLGMDASNYVLGREGATPLAGDFNGDGVDEIAVFLDGVWFIDLNGNGRWDEGDLWARMGQETDLPVVGDWDGDGKDDIGVFGVAWDGDERALEVESGLPDKLNLRTGRPKNMPPAVEDAPAIQRIMKREATGQIRSDVIDHVFQYGSEGDVAIAGDWNGDGVSNIGVYRKGSWYLDSNGDGRIGAEDTRIENTGGSHDIPVVGDWNGDGLDDIGLFQSGRWTIDSNGDRVLDRRDRTFILGGPEDRPFVGDFDGDGVDDPAAFRAEASPDSSVPRTGRTHGEGYRR